MGVTTNQVAKTDEEFLREAAARIRDRMSRTKQNIIEIGRELIAVKDRVGHGNFLPWIEREFGVTNKTAERFMSVAEQFGDKFDIVSNLTLTVLYELAAPSTTEEVRTGVAERAAAGEKVTIADVRTLKDRALKKRPEPQASMYREFNSIAAWRRRARREAQKSAETLHKQVGAFHHELTNLLDEYRGRLQAFVESHPDLDDECKGCLMQALELNADRLQRLAQEIDGR